MAANSKVRSSYTHEPLEIDYLEPFIDSTIAASARFRRVLIVIITASILAFGTFWNSRAGSWVNSRVITLRNADQYLTLKEELSKKEVALQTLKDNEEEKKKNLSEEKAQLQTQIDNTSIELKNWLATSNIVRKDQLTPALQRLEAARVESVMLVRIPIFGNVLDVNDLGLIGGFTFVVILMWFRFSLWREYYNLSLTFKEAKSEHLAFCYKSLAMRQVLTVPPSLSYPQPQEKPWGQVVRVLYFLPVLVQFIVLYYDCLTFDTGWVISKFNTVFSISMSLSFLVLSALLTYWCFQLSSDIDKKWAEVAEDIRKALSPSVGGRK